VYIATAPSPPFIKRRARPRQLLNQIKWYIYLAQLANNIRSLTRFLLELRQVILLPPFLKRHAKVHSITSSQYHSTPLSHFISILSINYVPSFPLSLRLCKSFQLSVLCTNWLNHVWSEAEAWSTPKTPHQRCGLSGECGPQSIAAATERGSAAVGSMAGQ